jgi:hypothetical protein
MSATGHSPRFGHSPITSGPRHKTVICRTGSRECAPDDRAWWSQLSRFRPACCPYFWMISLMIDGRSSRRTAEAKIVIATRRSQKAMTRQATVGCLSKSHFRSATTTALVRRTALIARLATMIAQAVVKRVSAIRVACHHNTSITPNTRIRYASVSHGIFLATRPLEKLLQMEKDKRRQSTPKRRRPGYVF